MFSKGAAREQRGVGARADWLVRYLRSRTADGGIPPPFPQTDAPLKLRLFAQKLGPSWTKVKPCVVSYGLGWWIRAD